MESSHFKWSNELTHAIVSFYANASVADVRAFKYNTSTQQLSYRELLYVYTIATTENCTAKDLVSLFGVSKSMVSQMISKLEEKKLVVRMMDDRDNRVYHIKLSPESTQEFAKKIEFVDLAVNRLRCKFPDKDMETASRIINELTGYMTDIGYEIRKNGQVNKNV